MKCEETEGLFKRGLETARNKIHKLGFSFAKMFTIGTIKRIRISSTDQMIIYCINVDSLLSITYENSSDFKKYIFKYLEEKGHRVCNLFASGPVPPPLLREGKANMIKG